VDANASIRGWDEHLLGLLLWPFSMCLYMHGLGTRILVAPTSWFTERRHVVKYKRTFPFRRSRKLESFSHHELEITHLQTSYLFNKGDSNTRT